jgi:hypothetical protein
VLELVDFQVVNGLQTINCIKAMQDEIGDRGKVLMKIVCTQSDDASSQIVIGANSQNKFGPAELLSQHPFVRRLQQYCDAVTGEDGERLLWLERRVGEYELHQDGHGHKMVNVNDVMRALISAFMERPELAQTANWDALRAMVPDRLFNDLHPQAIYHSAGLIYRRARTHLESERGSFSGYPAKNHLVLAMRILAEPKNGLAWPGEAALIAPNYKAQTFAEMIQQVLLSERSGNLVAKTANDVLHQAAAALGRQFNSKSFRDAAMTQKVIELARLARR